METSNQIKLKKTGFPRWSIFLLTLQQGLSSSITWGIVFAITIAAQAVAFVVAYPNVADRIKMAASLSSSSGIQASIGQTIHIETVTGYTQWKGFGVVVLIAAILGYLMATKFLRGEEESGRDEIMLAGQTNGAFTVIQKFLGIAVNILILSSIPTIALCFAGKGANVGIDLSQSIKLGLGIFAVTAIFAAIGGFFSQVFPTRSQANFYSLLIFALSYLVRAGADATNSENLRAFTPLGWIENFKPLTEGNLIELLPALILCVLLIGFSIYFASRRDLFGSILPDRDTAKAKTKLLSSSFGFSFRQSYPALIIWILSIGASAAFYAGITKASLTIISNPTELKAFGGFFNTQQAAYIYIGLIFLIFMVTIMILPAGFLAGVRNEEASGELDTLIAQPVSRTNWLIGKICLIFAGIAASSLFCSTVVWLVLKTQSINLDFWKMFYAGVNLTIPAIFLLGIGVLAFAILPRLASIITYGIVGTSFLIEMLASVIKNQKWILDLSVLHHMNYAPATDPNWHNNWIMVAIAIIAAAIGVAIFSQRDIVNE